MKAQHQYPNGVLPDKNSADQHLIRDSSMQPGNHPVVNPLSIIEDIIEGLVKNYRELERKEGKYIAYRLKKNRELINDLNKAYDSLAFLKWYDLWANVEASIDKLMEKDPSLSGFTFRVRTKMKGENFALIILD